jgi:3(or 17)beta-hydroxysteroid dehydrogenase
MAFCPGTKSGSPIQAASNKTPASAILGTLRLVGDPDLAAYNASKGGVRVLTKSAALHCAKTGTGIR